MTKITFWVIRHKPSGGYLPQPMGREKRGGSHVEVTKHIIGKPETEPRLCTNRRSAVAVLNAWMNGKYVTSRGGGYMGREDWEDFYEETYIMPQPHRVREEMEIIPLDLEIP